MHWQAQVTLTGSYGELCDVLVQRVAALLLAGAAVVVLADCAFGPPTFTDRVSVQS